MAEKLLMMKVAANQTMPHGSFCFRNSPFNMSQIQRFKPGLTCSSKNDVPKAVSYVGVGNPDSSESSGVRDSL